MDKLIIKLTSYVGDDTSLQVNTTGHPETDEMYCIVTVENGEATDVDYGYRTFAEAEKILADIAFLEAKRV
jgi:hypothetical protein